MLILEKKLNRMFTQMTVIGSLLLAIPVYALAVDIADIGYDSTSEVRENMLPEQLIMVDGNDISPCTMQFVKGQYLYDQANALIHYRPGDLNPYGKLVETTYTKKVPECKYDEAKIDTHSVYSRQTLSMVNGATITSQDYQFADLEITTSGTVLYEEDKIPQMYLSAKNKEGYTKTEFGSADTLTVSVYYNLLRAKMLLHSFTARAYFVVQLDNQGFYQYTAAGEFIPYTGMDSLQAFTECLNDENFNQPWQPLKDFDLSDFAKTHQSLAIYAGFAYCDGSFPLTPEHNNVIFVNQPLVISLHETDLSKAPEVNTVYYNSRKNRIWYTETLVDGVRHGPVTFYNYYDGQPNYSTEYNYGTQINVETLIYSFGGKDVTYYNEEGHKIKFEYYDSKGRLLDVDNYIRHEGIDVLHGEVIYYYYEGDSTEPYETYIYTYEYGQRVSKVIL